jgi:hypothetical protein
MNINEKLASDVQRLLNYFEQSQWIHIVDYNILKDNKIKVYNQNRRIHRIRKRFGTS